MHSLRLPQCDHDLTPARTALLDLLLLPDLLCELVVALTAHGLIHVLPADHLSDMLGRRTDVKGGLMIASLADGLQLLDLLTLRHQVDDGREHGTYTGGVKRCDDYHFTMVGGMLGKSGDL